MTRKAIIRQPRDDDWSEAVHFTNELGKRIDIAVLIPKDARTLEFSIVGPTTETTCGLTMMEARELVKLIRKVWERSGCFPEVAPFDVARGLLADLDGQRSAKIEMAAKVVDRLKGMRLFAQDIIDHAHATEVVANAYGIRDEVDAAISVLELA